MRVLCVFDQSFKSSTISFRNLTVLSYIVLVEVCLSSCIKLSQSIKFPDSVLNEMIVEYVNDM